MPSPQAVDFTGTETYGICGRVTMGVGGPGAANVTVNLRGSQQASVVTDGSGAYCFGGLIPGQSYMVTPSSQTSGFAPASAVFSMLDGQGSADFSVAYKISGRVVNAQGTPLPGTTVKLTGGQSATTQTDENGSYSFANLPVFGSYTVEPTKVGYNFNPNVTGPTSLQSDSTFDFQWLAQTYAIKGTIRDGAGNPIKDAVVSLSGTESGMTTTGADGQYVFPALRRGGSFTITASHQFYGFAPESRSIDSLVADSYASFDGTRRTFIISGYARELTGAPLAGASISLTGGQTGSATTDADGYYSLGQLPAGYAYTLTASRPFMSFDQSSIAVDSLDSNRSIDFWASRQRYSISGFVRDQQGNGLVNARVNLAGRDTGISMTATTGPEGFYSFDNVEAGRSYTLTASLDYYEMSPQSSVVGPLDANRTIDFAAARQTRQVDGHVTDSLGAPLPGVTLALSGSQTLTATSDASGYYSFPAVNAGESYTLTPSRQYYDFNPQSQPLFVGPFNRSFDFTGTRQTYPVLGRITDAGGLPLRGISVALGGGQTASATTNDNGYYSFFQLPAGESYTLTPSLVDYEFAPQRIDIGPLTSPSPDNNFVGKYLRHDIVGHISTADNMPLENVTVTLSGPEPATTRTNADGFYAFSNVLDGGPYTVTPSLAYYEFNAPVFTIPSLSAVTPVDFKAARRTYDIGGRVTDGAGNPLSYVSVTVSGPVMGSLVTDAYGNYSFRALAAGFDYVVTPSAPYYNFAPQSTTVTALDSNRSVNFSATRQSYSLSGRVVDGAGNALAGATVTLSGAKNATATTDAGGSYVFNGLAAGYSYTLTPSLQYYDFSPQSLSVVPLNANRTIDFTGARQLYAITGRVADAQGMALSGVTITLGGAQAGAALTDASGNYSFANLPAGRSYSLTPAKAGYNFAPSAANISALAQNTAVNFSSARNLYQLAGSVKDACGFGMSGVTLTLSGGQSQTTTTDASGNYVFGGVPSLNDYTITPGRAGFVFAPASLQFTGLLGSRSDANFTARPAVTTLNAGADAYVADGSATTNFGASTQLITRLSSKTGSNNQSYLKFDLGNFCDATKVLLRVYGRLSDTKATSLPLNVYGVSVTTWAENTLTWNNRPADGGVVLQTASVTGTTARWYDLDITSYVKSELAAGRRTVSFVLKNGTATTTTQSLFDSREAANKPQLVVTIP